MATEVSLVLFFPGGETDREVLEFLAATYEFEVIDNQTEEC